MELSFTQKKSIRKNFGKLIEGLSIPNLIEVQKNSYNEFLTSNEIKEKQAELSKGINKVFNSVFPIEDGTDKSTVEYISYKLEKPKLAKALEDTRNNLKPSEPKIEILVIQQPEDII